VHVENEYASLFQGLGADSIVQKSRQYGAPSTYSVTFTPQNRVVERCITDPATGVESCPGQTIYFNYPSSVEVPEDSLKECYV